MSEACPVCGSADLKPQGDYRGTHPAFLEMKRARCLTCEMVFATPMPSEFALHQFNASYFTTAHGGHLQSRAGTAFFSAIARLRGAHLDRYLLSHATTVSRVLELGPGTGFFARNWLENHPSTIYTAIETDSSCHASLAKLGVRLVEDVAAHGASESVDLVVMSHVLEHVSNPRQFLSDSTRNLRKGGAVFIEVPCRDCEHKSMDEPHLLFFDKAPMKYLLHKFNFGDIEVSYHGQEIAKLRTASNFKALITALRAKIINWGFSAPFGHMRPGMECLSDPLERAAIAPYLAHRESLKPSWWLRVLATKR